MSRQSKQQETKGIISELQDEMCDSVYRYLYFLMTALRRSELDVELDDGIIIRFTIDFSDTSKTFYIYIQESKTSGRRNIGYINFTSKHSQDDAVLLFILGKKEYNDSRADKYAKWFSNLKNRMQDLMDEQKKFEEILNDLRNIPIFSPQREVLIEKK